MANRYKFSTSLDGFINVYEDSGKFNNRCFSYMIPPETLEQVESDRAELIKWAKSKSGGRVQEAMTPWDDGGICKYSYGAGDGSRKPKPEPVFVDCDGQPVEKSVLKDVRKGTQVNLIVDQKPYSMGPNVGTSMRVIGVQIVKLVTAGGAVDSGELSADDVAGMFGSTDGYKQSEPAVRQDDSTKSNEGVSDYDF